MNLGQDLHGTGRTERPGEKLPKSTNESFQGNEFALWTHSPHSFPKEISLHIIQQQCTPYVGGILPKKLKSLSIGPRHSGLETIILFLIFVFIVVFDSFRTSSRVSHLSGTYIPRCIPGEDNWPVFLI